MWKLKFRELNNLFYITDSVSSREGGNIVRFDFKFYVFFFLICTIYDVNTGITSKNIICSINKKNHLAFTSTNTLKSFQISSAITNTKKTFSGPKVHSH